MKEDEGEDGEGVPYTQLERGAAREIAAIERYLIFSVVASVGCGEAHSIVDILKVVTSIDEFGRSR